MNQRKQTLIALFGLSLVLPACTHGDSPSAPALAITPDSLAWGGSGVEPLPQSVALGGLHIQDETIQGAVAIYELTIDPDTLTVTVSNPTTRMGMATDDLYNFSAMSFFDRRTLRIVGVSASPGAIDLTWQVSHPFPAPSNPAGTPNGSTNRADLGFAGQLVFLSDVGCGCDTYFSDVLANTTQIQNADAYLEPKGLLNLTGMAATAFPCQSLVDETIGNVGSRMGVSNLGQVTGNFGADGWTRAELSTGWTGYGVLHQGQRTRRVVRITNDAINEGFNLSVAVLAKYNDPRGGTTAAQLKANRLPPAIPDIAKFAYRMPHGALDVERIEFLGESGGFLSNTISLSTLRFRVTDWDARATETVLGDLAADPNLSHVAIGEADPPALAVCIPGVLGDATVADTWNNSQLADDDSAYGGGDIDEDFGEPGDGLFYEKAVTKTVGGGQVPGTKVGLVRAIDAEMGLASGLTAFLGGNLQPLTGDPPEPITYQAFSIDLAAGAPSGFAAVWCGPNGEVIPEASTVDSLGNSYIVGTTTGAVDYDPGSPKQMSDAPEGGYQTFCLALGPAGEFLWVSTIEGVDPVAPGLAAPYAVSATSGGAPIICGQQYGAVDFDPGTGTQVRSPLGSSGAFCLALDSSGNFRWVASMGGASNLGDAAMNLAINASDEPRIVGGFTGTTDFDPGAGVQMRSPVGLAEGFCLALSGDGAFQWVDVLSGTPGNINVAQGVAIDSLGGVAVVGDFQDSVDFDPGADVENRDAGVSSDGFHLSLSPSGAYQRVDIWGGDGYPVVSDCVLSAGDAPRITGHFGQTADFDPGVGIQSRTATGGSDAYCLALSNTGAFEWVATFSGTIFDPDRSERIRGLCVDSSDGVRLTGQYQSTVDFDPGAGAVNRMSAGEYDAFCLALSPTGIFEWVVTWGGADSDEGYGVQTDSGDNLRVLGRFGSPLDLNPGPGTYLRSPIGRSDAFLIGLNSAGTW